MKLPERIDKTSVQKLSETGSLLRGEPGSFGEITLGATVGVQVPYVVVVVAHVHITTYHDRFCQFQMLDVMPELFVPALQASTHTQAACGSRAGLATSSRSWRF